jgi:hypothetical protein
MEDLMGTVGGGIVVPEGRLFRSHYDLYDEYGTMLFGSGCRVEVAKALINLHCSPKGTVKRRRIQSIVKTRTKPADIPKPPGLKPTVPKAPLPSAMVDAAAPEMEVKEGEIPSGKALLLIKGKEVVGTSSAPLDKEVETLEELNVDETGKLRLFGFHQLFAYFYDLKNFWFLCCFAAVSESMKQLLAIMLGPGTAGILPPDAGTIGQDFVFYSNSIAPEGDFGLDAEFNAALAETSTSDAAFIVAGLNKKLALASRALM